ncbi:AaceriAGL328Cp [[Ashbya] aceris (nom. inval.)]|nr:AaceriAGL328Cp [[Ashbya] aceris (nom. inval.)]
MRGQSLLAPLMMVPALVAGTSIQGGKAQLEKRQSMPDDLVAAVGGKLSELRSKMAVQQSKFFDARGSLKSIADSLGVSEQDVSSVSAELESVMAEMSEMFPQDAKQLRFVSEPRGDVRKVREWDNVVRADSLKDYQLRVRKVSDPAGLGVDPGVKQYSGYLDVEAEDKHFFYWFFESRNDPKNDPIVLWLNGGPGCSSMTGLFFELGPSSIDQKLKPVRNPYSWNTNASVIFLDQPVNAGYSYSSNSVTSTVAASKDVYAFLELFFRQFPEYRDGQKFHIAGESYAGHYIPAIAAEILSHPDEERSFKLSSVLIGNGLTDPLTQYPYYERMACGGGGEPAILGPEQCSAMNETLPRCLRLIRTCYTLQNVWSCVPASLYCNGNQLAPFQRTGKNVYDVRKDCEGQLCYDDMKYSEEYLNTPEVIKAVGAEVDSFTSCNFDVNRNFLLNGDWMKPYQRHVTEILDKGLPVLIYAGDKDFICNWLGNRAWTDELPWKHHDDFTKQPIKPWSGPSGDQAGEVKNYKHFTYLRVFGAGHMVPYDVPENSLDMLNTWLQGDFGMGAQA